MLRCKFDYEDIASRLQAIDVVQQPKLPPWLKVQRIFSSYGLTPKVVMHTCGAHNLSCYHSVCLGRSDSVLPKARSGTGVDCICKRNNKPGASITSRVLSAIRCKHIALHARACRTIHHPRGARQRTTTSQHSTSRPTCVITAARSNRQNSMASTSNTGSYASAHGAAWPAIAVWNASVPTGKCTIPFANSGRKLSDSGSRFDSTPLEVAAAIM